MSLADELRWMRTRWAAREPVRKLPTDWFPTPPAPLVDHPSFSGRHAADLWTRGTLDWGWVWVAHAEVWDPGDGSGVGQVFYSDDPVLRRDPRQFQAIAGVVWAERERPEPAPGRKWLRAWARGEHPGDDPEPVPRDFSEGRRVWSAPLMVWRQVLPGGFLRHGLVPIVRPPEHDLPVVCLAPREFWSPELVARWSERD